MIYILYNLFYLPANQSIASGSHSNNSNNASNDWNFPGGQPRPGQRNAQDTTLQGLLSTSPMPEFWCSILYFELDTQVCVHRSYNLEVPKHTNFELILRALFLEGLYFQILCPSNFMMFHLTQHVVHQILIKSLVNKKLH